MANKKFESSLVGHTNWIRRAKFSPTSSLVASCADDKTIKLFDTKSGECIHTFTERKGSGRDLAWNADGGMIAVGLSCNRVKIFDIRERELLQLYHVHTEAVNSVDFHPSGHFMISGSDDETLKIYNLLEGRPIYTITGHIGKVTAVAFSHDGKHFATGGQDHKLMIWRTNFSEIESRRQSKEFVFEESGINFLSNTAEYEQDLATPRSVDESIIINPRSSRAFNEPDENFKLYNAGMSFDV